MAATVSPSQVKQNIQISVPTMDSVVQTIFDGRIVSANGTTTFSERIYEPNRRSLREHASNLGIATRDLVKLDMSFGRILFRIQNANSGKAREIVEEAQRRIEALESRSISKKLFDRGTLNISETDLRREILAVFREKAPEYIYSLADEKWSDISLKEVPKWLIEKAKKSNSPLIKAIRRHPIIAILVSLLVIAIVICAIVSPASLVAMGLSMAGAFVAALATGLAQLAIKKIGESASN
ncbi:MAG: hypothetical protein LBF25_03230 [Puniceicoccales bacterium]|jgi:hypothetical protein|nr:hypothetical protein [Puniceicoccales bacterium]